MVFGFFRKRKAQPTAQQQEAELVQAVEEAVQTEEVATQAASETAEQAAAQTPAAEIAVAESELTDLATGTSAYEPASTEIADAEAVPAQPEVLAEPGLAATQTDETAPVGYSRNSIWSGISGSAPSFWPPRRWKPGFSCPSTAPLCSAGCASANDICVGLAPSAA